VSARPTLGQPERHDLPPGPAGQRVQQHPADDHAEPAGGELGSYEELLLDRVLAIGPVVDARSTFAIRTVLSRGPLPLQHEPPAS
jgi:Lrp/AsnC family transcriptional regulator, leucine-responsive regulatory protein